MNFGRVFVVIPVFGRAEALALVPHVRACCPGVRVVVVDNGNEPELAARLRGLEGPGVHVVRCSENRGGTGGFNAGMRHVLETSKGADDLVWLLDDDAWPRATTLSALLEVYDEKVARGERVASVGSAIVCEKGGSVITECGAHFLHGRECGVIEARLAGARLEDYPGCVLEVEYSAACSCLVPVAVLRRVGLWCERFFLHYDEIEWCLRAAIRFGYRNYATTRSVVEHPPSTLQKTGDWIVYFDMRNALLVCARYARWNFICRFANLTVHALGSMLLGRRKGVYFFYRLVWLDLLLGRYRTRRDIVERFSRYGW